MPIMEEVAVVEQVVMDRGLFPINMEVALRNLLLLVDMEVLRLLMLGLLLPLPQPLLHSRRLLLLLKPHPRQELQLRLPSKYLARLKPALKRQLKLHRQLSR